MVRPTRRDRVAAVLLAIQCVACSDTASSVPEQEASAKTSLGLMTSLPIYWQESEEFSDLLRGDRSPHWVRLALEKRYRLQPLDTLGSDDLAQLDCLLLAQPRALSPAENVALDNWVRDGGRLLLFADPLLTQETQFALGDARAPQAVALLSPILERWGLELLYDEAQEQGRRMIDLFDFSVPVDLAGSFERSGDGAGADCSVSASGIAAVCQIGQGHVVLIADAAMLDTVVDDEKAGVSALNRLSRLAFTR